MKLKLFLLAALGATVYFAAGGCSCKTCGDNDNVIQVADSIFKKTDKFIISKTGKEFFENHIHADFLGSRKKQGKYEVRYNFRMIDYDFVDEEILIVTDSLGNISGGALIKGIPGCMYEETGCSFIIDRKRAIEIGIANELPEGIKEWNVEFRWSAEVNKYVWHIIVTTNEFGSRENYKADGEEIIIHPSSGEVLKKREWSIR
jgi:hypothetical protein